MSARDNFLRDVPWTRQPPGPLLARRAVSYLYSGDYVQIGNQIHTTRSRVAGTVYRDPGPGGIGHDGDGVNGSYIDVGGLSRANFATTGFTHIVQFQSGTTQSTIFGFRNSSGEDGEFIELNADKDLLATAGAINVGTWDQGGNVVRAGTVWPNADVGLSDGRVHTVVWVLETTTTVRLFLDGRELTLGYLNQYTLGAGSSGTLAMHLLGTNHRTTAYATSTDKKLYLQARLPYRIPASEAAQASVNPWVYLFAPLPRRIFVSGTTAGAYTLTADVGTYTLNGQDATLLKSKSLTADVGTYTLTGQDATLTRGRILTAEFGAFALSGQDATLTYTSFGAYTLTAETGTFILSGQDATLLKSRILSGEFGAFTLTGQDASFNYVAGTTYTLTADYGTFSLNGQNATLLKSNVLTAEFGAFSLTGQSATLTYTGAYTPPPDQADFTLSFPGGLTQRIGASSESADTIRIGPSSASGSTQRILH